jgi:hypothetical protein
MKFFYWCIAIVLLLTILAVFLVPGVDDLVEQLVQRHLGRAAR